MGNTGTEGTRGLAYPLIALTVLCACSGGDHPAFAGETTYAGGLAAPCERADEPPDTVFRLTGALEGAEYWECRPQEGDGPLDVDSIDGTQATVTGSTAHYDLEWSGSSSAAGNDLLFWVGNNSPGAGYFRIPIGTASSGDPVVDGQPLGFDLRVQSDAPTGAKSLNFALADEAEADNNPPEIGAIRQSRLQVIGVGGGDVQINLNWRTLVDLDLHVIDPESFEIYYGATESPSGGTLDLDSRAACSFDDRGAGNENVFWREGQAPSGEYQVVVDMFSDCDTYARGDETDFTVTVILGGEDVSVYEGTFTEAGPQSDVVTTFAFP